jgi:DNA-binding CsgD family transcriptional regulator
LERVQTTGYGAPGPDDSPPPVVLCVNFTIRLDGDRTAAILDEHPAAGWTITRADAGELPGAGDARAANGSPRDRDGASRLSALTKRELQVATLVGDCLTNRAIARQLSVAEKTVEMHLSNVFGKLAVSSRTELAALMIRTQRA